MAMTDELKLARAQLSMAAAEQASEELF